MLLFCSFLISYAYLNYVFTFMVNNSLCVWYQIVHNDA